MITLILITGFDGGCGFTLLIVVFAYMQYTGSEKNTATLTFDGIDVMGERLADEVGDHFQYQISFHSSFFGVIEQLSALMVVDSIDPRSCIPPSYAYNTLRTKLHGIHN